MDQCHKKTHHEISIAWRTQVPMYCTSNCVLFRPLQQKIGLVDMLVPADEELEQVQNVSSHFIQAFHSHLHAIVTGMQGQKGKHTPSTVANVIMWQKNGTSKFLRIYFEIPPVVPQVVSRNRQHDIRRHSQILQIHALWDCIRLFLHLLVPYQQSIVFGRGACPPCDVRFVKGSVDESIGLCKLFAYAGSMADW